MLDLSMIEGTQEALKSPSPTTLVLFDKKKHMEYVETIMDLDSALNDSQIKFETMDRIPEKGGKKISYEEYADMIVENEWLVYMLILDDQCIGYMHILPRTEYVDNIYIGSFIVSSDYAGKGYGQKMMEAFFKLEKYKKSHITVAASAKNKAGVGLYRKMGFEVESFYMLKKKR